MLFLIQFCSNPFWMVQNDPNLCQIFFFVKKVKYWVYSFHLSAKPPTTVVVVGQMGWIFFGGWSDGFDDIEKKVQV